MPTIDPTREGLAAFTALPQDEPIHMLNLLAFRALAEYPAGHPDHGKGITGRAAYRTYARAALGHIARLGGRTVWSGRPDAVVIGPAERWDAAFVIEYPSAAAFLRMVADADYLKAAIHRTAALADSRLVRMKPVSLDEILDR